MTTINTSLFPHRSFPIRLEHQDKQRGSITCFFQCEDHLEKYLERGKLDRKNCIILTANEQSIKPSQTDQREVVSKPRKDSSGSTNTSRKLPPKLDSPANTSQPRKPGRPKKNP